MRTIPSLALILVLAALTGCTETTTRIIHEEVINEQAGTNTSILTYRIEKNEALHEEFPNEPKYAERLARLYWQQDDHSTALEYLDTAREIDPDETKYDYLEAQIYNAIGSERSAEKAYKRIIARIGDEYAGPDYELGWLYFNQGKHRLAERHWRRCLEVNEYFPGVYYSLGRLFDQRRQRDMAIRHYEEFLRLGGGNKSEWVVNRLHVLQPQLSRVTIK